MQSLSSSFEKMHNRYDLNVDFVLILQALRRGSTLLGKDLSLKWNDKDEEMLESNMESQESGHGSDDDDPDRSWKR